MEKWKKLEDVADIEESTVFTHSSQERDFERREYSKAW